MFLGSCASDDALTEQTQDPEPDVPTIPFTGTITTGNGPSAVAQALTADDGPFHALSDEGTTLKATWEVGDELALIVNGTLCKATVSEVTGNKAYISASVPATVSDGAEARLIYPYTAVNESTLEVKAGLLSEQDGTLATIAKELDVCKGSGTLSVANNTAKLKADVTMLEQYCIWRFATQCNGSALPATRYIIAFICLPQEHLQASMSFCLLLRLLNTPSRQPLYSRFVLRITLSSLRPFPTCRLQPRSSIVPRLTLRWKCLHSLTTRGMPSSGIGILNP